MTGRRSLRTLLLPAAVAALPWLVSPAGVYAQGSASPLSLPSPATLSTPFTRIAREVGPAVVNINTETLPHAAAGNRSEPGDPGGNDDESGRGDPGDPQDFFRRFFGGPGGSNGQGEERALGSGFIVDSHGYIVTNEHVIDKADRIYVKLTTDPPNDQGHRATVVGADRDTDLAVIKIDLGHPLPTLKVGNSEGAQVGDWVEAIGSPFDLSQTVTTGIVSAKNRNVGGPIGGQFKHYIQTDAAINPGNSGGPLLAMDGEVIGVNTALITQSNGYMGIGFAIPSNTVIDVYNQLIGPAHKVVRGSLGISFQPNISSAVAKMYGAGAGVLISTVTPGGAAEKAGLRPNDVIVSVDGSPIKDGDALVDSISPRKPGSTVSIGYLRGGQRMTATCVVGDRAETVRAANDAFADPSGAPEAHPGRVKLGLGLRDLPSDAPKTLHGVLVQSVTPGSFADDLDPQIGPGVIIEEVNRKPVTSLAEFDAIVGALHSGDDVVFRIAYPNAGGQTTLTGGVLP